MATEKRLVYANEVEEIFNYEVHAGSTDLFDAFDSAIQNATTVDAVEVVRCKDCKSWEQYNACDGTKPHRCMNHNAIFYKLTAPDDFCSYGERRTDNA